MHRPLKLSSFARRLPAIAVSLLGSVMQERIDLKRMRLELDELARRLKLTKATRFVNVLDVGPARVREGSRNTPYETGYEVSLEIPVFDTGNTRVRRADSAG